MMAYADPIVVCEHHGPGHKGPHRLTVNCVMPMLAEDITRDEAFAGI